MTKVAVIQFPGSNCDLDVIHVLRNVLGVEAKLVWHREAGLQGFDAIILPGGFSYGDHLRAGIIAARSPVMKEVAKFAAAGNPVLGICNGFQILAEAQLLPGALLRNQGLRFTCRWVSCAVQTNRTPFTRPFELRSIMRMPVAHNEGRFYLGEEQYNELVQKDQIVFKYVTEDGLETPKANPNGSLHNIAGICSAAGNVVGLMPHPERASEPILDPKRQAHGLLIFQSLIESLA